MSGGENDDASSVASDNTVVSMEDGQVVTIEEAQQQEKLGDELDLMRDMSCFCLERDSHKKTWFLRHRLTLKRVDLHVPDVVKIEMDQVAEDERRSGRAMHRFTSELHTRSQKRLLLRMMTSSCRRKTWTHQEL